MAMLVLLLVTIILEAVAADQVAVYGFKPVLSLQPARRQLPPTATMEERGIILMPLIMVAEVAEAVAA